MFVYIQQQYQNPQQFLNPQAYQFQSYIYQNPYYQPGAVVVSRFNKEPVNITCPYCNQKIITIIEKKFND